MQDRNFWKSSVSNMHCTCPREHVEGNFVPFPWKKLSFQHFRTLSEKVLTSQGEYFDRVGKIILTCPEKHFREKISANKSLLFYHIGTFSTRIREYVFRGCQKCNLRVHLNFLMKSVSFWEEGFFQSIWCFFNTRPKMIRRDCQNGMVRVYENTLREVFPGVLLFLQQYRTLSRKFSAFFGMFSTPFTKLHSALVEDLSEEKVVLWKVHNISLSSIFGSCSKFFRHFVKFYSGRLSKSSHVSLGAIRGKAFTFRKGN